MEEKRTPDTQLAQAIRILETIIMVLREHYDSSKIDYYDYIKTEAWQEQRLKTFKRDGFKCVCCGAAQNLEAHHITYKNLGAELETDLVTLCRKCHEGIHSGDLEPTKEMKRKNAERRGPRKPQDLTYEEIELLRYATMCRERDIEIEDDYLFDPIWFQTQYGREQAEQFNAGGHMDDAVEDYIVKVNSAPPDWEVCTLFDEGNLHDKVVKDMYIAHLFRVFNVWACHWEKNYLFEIKHVNDKAKKEIKEKLIWIDEKRKQLKNAVGEI